MLKNQGSKQVYIKAYKLNATSGDYSFGLKFGTRENGVGTSLVGLTITPDQTVAINAESSRTTGGVAQLTIAGSSSLINMGPSNSDNMYIRRMGAGLFLSLIHI